MNRAKLYGMLMQLVGNNIESFDQKIQSLVIKSRNDTLPHYTGTESILIAVLEEIRGLYQFRLRQITTSHVS